MVQIITKEDARTIAADWHGGQFTGLYALASSGSLWLWENECHACGAEWTETEARRTRRDEESAGRSGGELRLLEAYIEYHAEAVPHTCFQD